MGQTCSGICGPAPKRISLVGPDLQGLPVENWKRKTKNKYVDDVLLQLLVGLDDSGKTSLLEQLRGQPLPQVQQGLPRPYLVDYDSVILRIYDLGGGRRMRAIWPAFLPDSHAIVFVVDSADTQRHSEAADTLCQLLRHPAAADKFVLVVANKQDLQHALSADELAWQLALEACPEYTCGPRACDIEKVCAFAGTECSRLCDNAVDAGCTYATVQYRQGKLVAQTAATPRQRSWKLVLKRGRDSTGLSSPFLTTGTTWKTAWKSSVCTIRLQRWCLPTRCRSGGANPSGDPAAAPAAVERPPLSRAMDHGAPRPLV
jgi:small GTP-binding protein